MEIIYTIIGSFIIVSTIFFLIVIIPVFFGKVFLRWSKTRVNYIFSQSLSTIVASVIGSLVLTAFVLIVGVIFNQEWAFSGGILLVYTFWTAIKTVKQNILSSKRMWLK